MPEKMLSIQKTLPQVSECTGLKILRPELTVEIEQPKYFSRQLAS